MFSEWDFHYHFIKKKKKSSFLDPYILYKLNVLHIQVTSTEATKLMESKLTNLSLHLSSCLILALLLSNKAATARSSKICNGSIAECSEEIEMFMESDISRRFLEERKKYITPGALKPDQPVCSGGGRGDAYSKSGGCLPPKSNSGTRGCPAYYRCRSGS